ncbi:MAG: cupin domain-containing protein [Polyangia bacterium]
MSEKAEKLAHGREKFSVDDRKWRDVGAGLSVLDINEEAGRRLQIVRLAPNGRILAHINKGTEIMYVVKGSLVVDGVRLNAGEVLTSPSGTIHRETWSAEGCELVIECSPEDELLRS